MAEEILPGGILGRVMPPIASLSLDAEGLIDQFVSEFARVLTRAVVQRCNLEKLRMANKEYVISTLMSIGFDDIVAPVRAYLHSYLDTLGPRTFPLPAANGKMEVKDEFPLLEKKPKCLPQPPGRPVTQLQDPFDLEYDQGKLVARLGDFLHPALGDVEAVGWRRITYEAEQEIKYYSSEFGLLICHRAAERCELDGRNVVSTEDVREVMASLYAENDEGEPVDAYLRWYHQTVHADEEVANIADLAQHHDSNEN